jgi:hypothetical protein
MKKGVKKYLVMYAELLLVKVVWRGIRKDLIVYKNTLSLW